MAAVRIVGVLTGLATVAALDFILLLGASGERPLWFGALVLSMDVLLLVSSIALGTTFLCEKRWTLGVLFLLNPIAMLLALPLRLSGVAFPRAVLFGADLYWLNLYLVGLVICIRKRPASPPNQS